MSNFTDISANYRQNSTLQKSAAGRLFEMLDLGPTDDVLDLGCGTGHLARNIGEVTAGRVMGIDPSPGMIAEAQRAYPDIEFRVGAAETLDVAGQFDAIFCNSTFQWFRDPARVAANCFRALRSGGRMAVQAPARREFSPNFVRAAGSLLHDARTREAFGQFRSPWFFLDTAEAYADIFRQAGFDVVASDIERVTQSCNPAKAMEMFESGAAAGYLNPDCYDIALSPDYLGVARELIARDFEAQAQADGLVELTFFRIYLLARRP